MWCREGYLTPERIANILRRYSAYAKQNDILAWYRIFQNQIIKDDILCPMFMMNNIQLGGELQREQDKKNRQGIGIAAGCYEREKDTQQENRNIYLIRLRIFIRSMWTERYSKMNYGLPLFYPENRCFYME